MSTGEERTWIEKRHLFRGDDVSFIAEHSIFLDWILLS